MTGCSSTCSCEVKSHFFRCSLKGLGCCLAFPGGYLDDLNVVGVRSRRLKHYP